ncbi:CDC14 protein-tyrosine phosphatase [Pyrenophora tritici-repentis]|uniref:protein-tyrosine-phosphatase n=1 Tax=Pyrenophora tritici-repentis TaxID=45151 RepID=A0A2W1EF83_9PLEO|nr:CDC14 protein-tyrosine phosphatase [Pyrenophora tritici-repentis]KAF7573205.1 CDC14, protein-tyrosine phosphatase [Pyrenophora tritici-repentis]KAG9381194.1 CDC14 protein-tyrosine phosphatase [Pyrenophora tritici-repentis]KAI0574180.1 CDC14 protein-tyrosine phosphatase [Pyrenophora tritici-repentis]KAI0583608.1 CDC14 protein-tyrosine phosphatase [Pyrenophora tritici-repentis]
MSYLLHGSTTHTGMGWLDLVPNTSSRLYIGGLYALYQTDLVEAANITHVLSVIDYEVLVGDKLKGLEHFHIRAEDHPNENLLQYFDAGIRFIESALDHPTNPNSKPGAIFVHCAMGKSRSATLVCAYLIRKHGVPPAQALRQLCEGRPICEPNVGFTEQLEVWARMCGTNDDRDKKRIYKEWENNRFTGEVWEWEKRGREVAKL